MTRLVLSLLSAVLVVAIAVACGGSSSGSPAGPTGAEPTAIRDFINAFAENDADAVSFAKEVFTSSCPPTCNPRIDTVQYVKTTVGQAKSRLASASDGHFDPGKRVAGWGADDLPIWIVVAKGQFTKFSIIDPTPGPPFSSLWVIFPMGRAGSFPFPSNAQYDLSQLGTVHNVPLPLPPFPTPVNLTPSEG